MSASSGSHSEKALHATAKVSVEEVLSSRYGLGHADRPQSWDQRREGIDVIGALGGASIRLRSSPMQSTPKPGWIIVLTGGSECEGYTWTLYGITRNH